MGQAQGLPKVQGISGIVSSYIEQTLTCDGLTENRAGVSGAAGGRQWAPASFLPCNPPHIPFIPQRPIVAVTLSDTESMLQKRIEKEIG